MPMRHDRLSCLATCHARLRLAADTLRWSLNAEVKGVIPDDQVLETVRLIERWSDQVWAAMHLKSTRR